MTSDAHSSDEPALFETKRLRCRRWIASDIDALTQVYGDAQAMRWVGDGEPLSREALEETVRRLKAALLNGSRDDLLQELRDAVPEYGKG